MQLATFPVFFQGDAYMFILELIFDVYNSEKWTRKVLLSCEHIQQEFLQKKCEKHIIKGECNRLEIKQKVLPMKIFTHEEFEPSPSTLNFIREFALRLDKELMPFLD